MKYDKKIVECARRFVSELNFYPASMIETLMKADPNSWHEVSVPATGNRVFVFESNCCGIIEQYNEDDETYTVVTDDGNETLVLNSDEFEVDSYSMLPMWGTLWSFSDSADNWWLEEDDGIRKMCECGFRVYEHEEWGYFFGIDGCGYDFYEAHWIPLYLKRDLHWHLH